MPPAQKQPITRSILGRIHQNLKSVDAFFWVICLVSLFGMLLKSHLIVKSARSFDASQKLSRSGFNPQGGLCHKNRRFRNTLPLLLFTYFKSTFHCGFSGFIITYIISLCIVRKVFRKMDINLVSSQYESSVSLFRFYGLNPRRRINELLVTETEKIIRILIFAL